MVIDKNNLLGFGHFSSREQEDMSHQYAYDGLHAIDLPESTSDSTLKKNGKSSSGTSTEDSTKLLQHK